MIGDRKIKTRICNVLKCGMLAIFSCFVPFFVVLFLLFLFLFCCFFFSLVMRCYNDAEPTDALIYSTAAQSTWMDNTSPGWECDQDKGESYLAQSSEKVSSPEACKQSCEADAQCRSITFYTSGWCSHFASACTNTRESEYALVSSRLGGARVTTTAVSKSTGALMLCAIRFLDRSICRCDCSFGRQKN